MLRQEMPNKREDLALVDSYIAFDGGLVRCAHCHKTSETDSETDGELRNI